MKKLLTVILLFHFSLFVYSTNKLDSLLLVLDNAVTLKTEYSYQKELSITSLKSQLTDAAVDKQRYNIYGKLFDLYSNYQTDSAYSVAQARVQLADKMGSSYEIAQSRMDLAVVLRNTGMFKETIEILQYLVDTGLKQEDVGYVYHLYHSLYMLMGDYAISEPERLKYSALVFNYKDSILQSLQSDDINYYLVMSSKQIMLGEFNDALITAQKGYNEYDYNSPMITYTLAEIYEHLGNKQKEKEFLAMSAIADLKSGVKEYISLTKLATLLYSENQVDRAYLYMKCAMEDAIFSNSRLRTLEVSQMLPLINATYDLKMQQEKKRLFILLMVTIGLAIILFGTLAYIYKQVKTLSSIRKYQKNMNAELKMVNSELQTVNTELSDVNSQLLDANLVKEEYIGYVFNICSSYIDKLEDFRVDVNRKIKTGKIKELEKTTSTSSLVADELKEFYKNFDSIFLNIYPTFIEEFNALMMDDGKITPKDGDLLTPELRIFALVRLGITDSTKIADFLHYSPQTIYNYRLKIRNKSLAQKGDFSAQVDRIGRI